MSERGIHLERVGNIILVVCALVFATILVKREFFDTPSRAAATSQSGPPERVKNWDQLRANAVALRAPDAPVVVLEFADLECPACKAFYERLNQTAAAMHANVGLMMVHYPLTVHRFARPAARAMECANAQGEGPKFVDVAYAKQDSFGLKPWASYAKEAGVPNLDAFQACAQDTARIARVEEGRRLGQVMEVHWTPTIIINGWRFPGVPTDEQLRSTIQALEAGKAPPGA